MNRIKMEESQHQNIRVELIDTQEKGLPVQGTQTKSKAALNVEQVILKGIKSNRIS